MPFSLSLSKTIYFLPLFSIIDLYYLFIYLQNAPATGINADYFSMRWTGQVQPLFTNVYTFYSTSDDGVRLYVNGVLVIDAWVFIFLTFLF